MKTMGNDSYPVKLTGSGTTTLNSCFLYGICINKTLVGTLTVNDSAVALAQFAIGTTPGMYHAIPNGGRYEAPTFVLSAGDDVTVYIKALS